MKPLITPSLLVLTALVTTAQVQPTAPGFPRSADVPEDSRDSYLAAMKKRIAINSRAVDPFGLPQVLTKKTWQPPGRDRETPNSVSLQRIVDLIPITAIDANRSEFMVGSRIFQVGDVIPIERGSFQATLRVEKVTTESVLFRNLTNDETATRTLRIGPKDLVAPSDISLPKGVDPTGRAPLRLPE